MIPLMGWWELDWSHHLNYKQGFRAKFLVSIKMGSWLRIPLMAVLDISHLHSLSCLLHQYLFPSMSSNSEEVWLKLKFSWRIALATMIRFGISLWNWWTSYNQAVSIVAAWLDKRRRTLSRLGTGFGILAIATLKFGAALIVRIDIAPQEITAATQNAALNNMSPNKMQLTLFPPSRGRKIVLHRHLTLIWQLALKMIGQMDLTIQATFPLTTKTSMVPKTDVYLQLQHRRMHRQKWLPRTW